MSGASARNAISAADGAQTTPTRRKNDLLHAARERKSSAVHPGKCMSRRELADAINAYVAEHHPTVKGAPLTNRSIGAYENGYYRWPAPHLRAAFRVVLNADTDVDLGFYSWWGRTEPDTHDDHHANPSAPRRSGASIEDPLAEHQSGIGDTAPAGTPARELVMTAAVGAATFAEHVQTSGVASATMELYWTDLAAAAADFVYQPVDEVVPRLLSLWKRVTAHLRVGARRSQSSDLYVLAGCTAVVLAHACHVLGRSREGMVQVTTAKLCAEEAGHRELLAWALGTQALLVQASGRPRQALDMLSAAQEVLIRSRRSGTAATRLAAYRARFSSQVGDLEQTDAAIQHTLDLDLRPNFVDDISDLDHIGGILSFGVAKRDFFLAEPYLRMGAFDEACRHSELAITTYTLGPEQQFSYGDVALAHLTAATARLSAGHLEAAVPSLTRVLDLPVAQRIQPLQAPLTEIAQILHGPGYRGVAAANDLRTAIGDFRRPPQGIIVT